MFNIGDQVWRATWDAEKTYVTCPDCGGTKHIRCILHDGSEVTIPCEGCSSGYNPPSGMVHYYKGTARAEPGTVSGVRVEAVRGEQITEYVVEGVYTHHTKAEDVFATMQEALVRAEARVRENEAEELARISRKDKPTKTWAWHVHYYRKQIRDAEKNIHYYTAKLNAATPHLKEEKAAKAIAKAKELEPF